MKDAIFNDTYNTEYNSYLEEVRNFVENVIFGKQVIFGKDAEKITHDKVDMNVVRSQIESTVLNKLKFLDETTVQIFFSEVLHPTDGNPFEKYNNFRFSKSRLAGLGTDKLLLCFVQEFGFYSNNQFYCELVVLIGVFKDVLIAQGYKYYQKLVSVVIDQDYKTEFLE